MRKRRGEKQEKRKTLLKLKKKLEKKENEAEMRLHTAPLHRPASTSRDARPSFLSCRAGEARTVAREQRRKEAALKFKFKVAVVG